MFKAEERVLIWLDSFPLSDGEKARLLRLAGNGVALVKNLTEIFPKAVKRDEKGVYNSMLSSLQDDGKTFRALLSDFEKTGITPVTLVSDGYPEELKSLQSPPLVLYCKGDVRLLKRRKFTFVGSRVTPPTALKNGIAVAEDLERKFVLVTGSADGGDNVAVSGALKGDGKVICVLAGGFKFLPKTEDFRRVTERGLILSYRTYDTPVLKFSFEKRNEILATLGEGTFVLSAGKKSGALITAKYAKRQNKPVFAYPYPPNVDAGEGCNALIKNGAHLTTGANDILPKFGFDEKEESGNLPLLTDEESLLFSILRVSGSEDVSGLTEKSGLPVWKIAGLLINLEVKGLISRTGGNTVSVVKR